MLNSRPAFTRALVCAIFVLAASGESASDPRQATLDVALEAARLQDLADDPMWRTLGHYRSGLTGPHVSNADAGFFLADGGARRPDRELIATIEALLAPADSAPENEHAQCMYPARFAFLSARLPLAAEDWPAVSCPEFDDWRRRLGVSGVSLVYPEGFMNSPASMLGHTLLRLDLDSSMGAHDLLGHGVDFTADTGMQAGPLYLLKGVAGLYDGHFGVNPYYQQFKRYAEWENRDVWEYRLALDPAEIDLLMAHLWELRDHGFPYLFFTRNCSDRLLEVLHLLRPEIHRVGGTPPFVVPADTVRAIRAVPGLVTEVTWRPSPARQLTVMLDELNRGERRLVHRIVDRGLDEEVGELAALADDRRALVLDAAYRLLRYRYVAGKISDESSRSLARSLLLARSRIDVVVPEAEPTRPDVAPDEGHGSSRVQLSGGYENGEGYIEAAFRLSYQDLLDPEGGYTKDLRVRFLDTRVRYQPGLERVRLHTLTLLEIATISPRSEVFRPFAWSFSTGLGTRRAVHDGSFGERALWRTSGGFGMSFEPVRGMRLYGLGEVGLDMGPGLSNVASFGPGAVIGSTLSLARDRTKLHAWARLTRYALGETATVMDAVAEQRVTLTRNTALRFGGGYHISDDHRWFSARAGFSFYF